MRLVKIETDNAYCHIKLLLVYHFKMATNAPITKELFGKTSNGEEVYK